MTLFSKVIFNDEPADGWLPWGAFAPVLAFVLFNIPLIAVMIGIMKPLGFVDENIDPTGPIGMAFMLFGAFGLAGCLFVLWVKYVERRPFSSVGLRGANPLRTFARGHLIGIGLMLVIITTIWAFGGYTVGSIAPALTSPIGLFHITLLLLGFAVQSSIEEFVFRGWLLSVLTRRFNLLAAILVSSTLFMFMHFNPEAPLTDHISVYAFSFFACAWVVKTGNIWGVMGWHAGWNWITAVGFEVPVTGLDVGTPALIAQLAPIGSDFLTGGEMGPEGSIITQIVLVLATIVVILGPQTLRQLKELNRETSSGTY